MADPPTQPDDTHDGRGVESRHGPATRTPLWVKVFGIITLIVLAVFVIALLGGGGHGPARHLSSGAAGNGAPPVNAVDQASSVGGLRW